MEKNNNDNLVINNDNLKKVNISLIHERKMTMKILGNDTDFNLRFNFDGQVMNDVIKQAVRMSKTDFGNMLRQWVNQGVEQGTQDAVDWIDSVGDKTIDINVETAGHRPSAPITTNAVANQWKHLDRTEQMKRLAELAKQVGVDLKMNQ